MILFNQITCQTNKNMKDLSSLPPRDVLEQLINELPSDKRIKAGSAYIAALRAQSFEDECRNTEIIARLLGRSQTLLHSEARGEPPFPHLARFLADHFGGYPSAQDAANEETGGDVNAYVDAFLPASCAMDDLKEADAFLAAHADFVAMRSTRFDDCGNYKRGKASADLPAAIKRIIDLNN